MESASVQPDDPAASPVNIIVRQNKCSQSVIALEGLGWQQGDVVSLQVDLLQDLQVWEGVLVEGLDVAVLEADRLEVVQSQGAENVLWKLIDVVSIHENLHVQNKKIKLCCH